MFGIALVGLSGSMVKDSLRESSVGFLVRAIEDAPAPEVTSALIGVFFILFAQILYALHFPS